jgi:hypothetical protein
MTQAVRTRRKNKFNFVKEGARLESFDEFPMLRPEVDPQLHMSRNTVDQPFWLRCAKDSVIAQTIGASRVMFADGPTRWFDTDAGDFVYVPAGYAHRVLTVRAGIMLRYKARSIGGETVLWFCDSCESEIHQYEIDTSGPVQNGYADACDAFNASQDARTCTCGTIHPQVDLTPFRWREVAQAILSDEEEVEVA